MPDVPRRIMLLFIWGKIFECGPPKAESVVAGVRELDRGHISTMLEIYSINISYRLRSIHPVPLNQIGICRSIALMLFFCATALLAETKLFGLTREVDEHT